MKHGKKYAEAAKLVSRAVAYEAEEAMALAKEHNIVLWDKDNLRQKVDVI